MAGSRRRRWMQRQRHHADAGAPSGLPPKPMPDAAAQEPSATTLADLPPELLAEILSRLDFVDRLNFAAGCGGAVASSLQWHKPEVPCLVLPSATAETATLFSLSSDGHEAAAARAPDPAVRGHVVPGSSGGWLVTADLQGALRIANPVTGQQAELPAITTGTIPFFQSSPDVLDMDLFGQLRFAGGLPDDDRRSDFGPPLTIVGWQMRKWFYRKVILSASPRPGSYAAMLILAKDFGAPAFATAEDPAGWRLAASADGVEDAIHHEGRFYSVTYSGAVEAWDRDAGTGEFVSAAAGPRLPGDGEDLRRRRKYIAAAPDGRLVAVLKGFKEVKPECCRYPREKAVAPVFEVQVLDEARRRWAAARDIGDLALFVGVNASMCVSAREHPGIRAGCVYYTEDELGQASLRLENERDGCSRPLYRSSVGADRHGYDHELRDLGVYVLKDGTVERVEGLGKHRCWPPPAWFTPSV